ncbi:DNA methyltransferase [Streptomyces sp. NPDC087270]|uniref:DNA methyltransferase n=1 Tax=Streptomyces sp. NPDC087270 TaxID=3365774 RepID=UPI0037FCFFAC
MTENRLFYGDNLEMLRKHVADESVDLVYLDPPFNSNRNYNIIFGTSSTAGKGATAQIQAFGDTWTWTHVTEQQYQEAVSGGVPGKVADALVAIRGLLTENDAMAYLVNMAPRLVELRRVLKPSGSLYLHCDPTMSHYLKVLLDSIFGAACFRNDIVWKRKAGRGETNKAAVRFGVTNDNILFYVKSSGAHFARQYRESNPEYIATKFTHIDPESGRRYRLDNLASPSYRANLVYEYKGYPPPQKGWAVSLERMKEMDQEGRLHFPAKKTQRIQRKRFLDELEGETVDSLWDDIPPINSQAKERLGYPTQKPVALLERILQASTSEGDIVLDPFCGCGTTIDAAIRLKRKWVGIDITYIAVDLIEKRLQHTFGGSVASEYEVFGIPKDIDGAQALFKHSPFDFERWAVSLIRAQPNEKQVGDKGVDGVARFPLDNAGKIGRVLASVKGGKTVTPQFVRDLVGTVETQKAQMGVLITMAKPSKGVLDAVSHGGTYTWPINGEVFPKIQVITVQELLSGERPATPSLLTPYIQASKIVRAADQDAIF